MKSKINYSEHKDDIIDMHLSGISQKKIGSFYGVSGTSILNYLKKWNIKRNRFSENDKSKIIDLYLNQKRGKLHIASLYNTSYTIIDYYLKKWNIPNWSREIIMEKVYEVHGYKSKGFKGKKHTKKSRNKISKSLIENYKNSDINRNLPKSKTIDTIIGKVNGSYEVAFIKKSLNSGLFPERVLNRIATPHGTYLPDFIMDDEYYEIKSQYTYDILIGKYKFDNYSSTQHDKIKWVSKNIKKVNIIILNKKEAWDLFKESLNTIVKSDIKIFNGNQYEICK